MLNQELSLKREFYLCDSGGEISLATQLHRNGGRLLVRGAKVPSHVGRAIHH